MNFDPYAWIADSLAVIHKADWYRSARSIAGRPGPTVNRDGQTVINLGSNDYLGLAGDERLIQAAGAALQEYGTGSTGSRLLSGQRPIHQHLEQAIAAWKQTEAALVFSSGYLANLSAITALVGKRDLIVADQYNHSSLKNGAILSGATVLNYAHADMKELERLLTQHRPHHRRCLILSDSVFSMDGDLCPLPILSAIAGGFNAMLLVDEAHGTGVLGATGAGVVEHYNCTGQPLIQVGTLSKALGSLGGYVAGSALLIDFLSNRAPGWIYTTGLSPADTAAALTAITIAQQEPQRRSRLWKNVDRIQAGLQAFVDQSQDLKLIPSQSPILCLELADPATALAAAEYLNWAGIYAPAIRPPTVPTSRLRFSLMATHTPEHCDRLLMALEDWRSQARLSRFPNVSKLDQEANS